MRSLSSLLVLVALVILPLAFAVTIPDISPQEARGAYRAVNTTDPDIIKLGQFSVSQHNKEAKKKLVFERVVSGRDALLLLGKYYELIVKAKDESLPTPSAANYKAVLFYKYNPWKTILKLYAFQKIKD
ncbi:cysteine proteinase inhibitor 5-like [Pyrus ussuriensis x Pyrus communis]|uniref:Cysteine proteinase inhibitor 5-like n=1 Tax=Pyrus ussuriensis x Pyrus communis TaxID=2448454 RepID=A0A5N5HMN1_9ROSA|nr:cysteine proteinase inhibitor 4-like [Pyrus x bretschneideri]KAB2628878.1 cysteine proteinase inhibitor 5-like [Pyrus ussuriensis x Pyrus communis]